MRVRNWGFYFDRMFYKIIPTIDFLAAYSVIASSVISSNNIIQNYGVFSPLIAIDAIKASTNTYFLSMGTS